MIFQATMMKLLEPTSEKLSAVQVCLVLNIFELCETNAYNCVQAIPKHKNLT